MHIIFKGIIARTIKGPSNNKPNAARSDHESKQHTKKHTTIIHFLLVFFLCLTHILVKVLTVLIINRAFMKDHLF